MASDGVGGPTGQEISRRIREELDRIRESEGRVEEALEAVRQARRRVELIARDLGREEDRVRALVREELKAAGARPAGGESAARADADRTSPAPAAPRAWRSDPSVGWSTWREAPTRARDAAGAIEPDAVRPAATPERRPAAPDAEALAVPRPAILQPQPVEARPSSILGADRRWQLAGIAALAAAVVAVVGWFAIRGLREGSAPAAVSTDPPPPVVAAPAPEPEPAVVEPAVGAPLAQLPADPAARLVLYDSLFAARSSLFDPLLATIETEAADRSVPRAVASWRDGSVDAQEADLIHSALLQYVLKAEVNPQIEIDGQVLRNPCRGSSCSALLNLWERQRERYGLSAVPEDAPTNTTALRQAEAALVLGWMQERATAAEAPSL